MHWTAIMDGRCSQDVVRGNSTLTTATETPASLTAIAGLAAVSVFAVGVVVVNAFLTIVAGSRHTLNPTRERVLISFLLANCFCAANVAVQSAFFLSVVVTTSYWVCVTASGLHVFSYCMIGFNSVLTTSCNYIFITRPFVFEKETTVKMYSLAILSSWFLSLTFALLPVFNVNEYTDAQTFICSPVIFLSRGAFFIMRYLFAFPTVIASGCLGIAILVNAIRMNRKVERTAKVLAKNDRQPNRKAPSALPTISKSQKQSAVVAVKAIIFFITWFPYFAGMHYAYLFPQCLKREHLQFFILLPSIVAIVTPVAIIFRLKVYRQPLKKTVERIFCSPGR